MFMMNLLITIISILISVAFFTIMERKILSYIQIRKGPNKVGMLGILQPFSDAIKLFNKNLISSEMMNFSLSYMAPAMTLFISMIILTIIPFNYYSMFDNKHSMLLFFILSSFSVYSILLVGWSANSKFSQLGAIRNLAQMISYEVSFFMIILFIMIMSSSYSMNQIMESQLMLHFFWGNLMLMFIWMISCLAETNRNPFDFAEGESELVSGFNVEYMGGWFAFIFLAEYMSMLIMSMMTIVMFFKNLNSFSSMIFLIMMIMMFIWVRGTLPRFRYDMLMNLNWKIFLTISLFLIPLSLTQSFFFL